MLLLAASALAAESAATAAERLVKLARSGADPTTWFDVQAYTNAEWLPVQGFLAYVAMEGGGGGGGAVLEILEDGIDDTEWARLRTDASTQAAHVLNDGKCKPTRVSQSWNASPNAAPEVAWVWPERTALRRITVVELACDPAGVPVSAAVPTHLALTEGASGWRIGSVIDGEGLSLWEKVGDEATIDVKARDAARQAAIDALPGLTLERWQPPHLPRQAPSPPGDLDEDGHPDIVLGRFGSNRAGVVIGGKLSTLRGLFPSSRYAEDAALAGDVDGDGHADLVLDVPGYTGAGQPDVPGSIWIFPGGPALDLTRHRRADAPDPTDNSFAQRFVAPGDMDGDGRAELVAQSLDHHEVDVFFGGALDTPGAVLRYPQKDFILLSIDRAGDVDGDKLADLWIRGEVGNERNRTWLLHGGTTARLDEVNALSEVQPIGAGDVDGDGRDDLVGVRDGKIEVWRAGSPWKKLWSDTAADCDAGAVGDLDADGRAEVIVGCAWAAKESGEVRIYSGAGQLRARLDSPSPKGGFGRTVAVPGDTDGDGKVDLIVTGKQDGYRFGDPLHVSAPSETWRPE